MKIISSITDFEAEAGTVITIGKFDGIHRGHQKLLNRVLTYKEMGLYSIIFTFDIPPASLLCNEETSKLMTTEEKYRAFEQRGIDLLVEFPLTKESAAISAEKFIRDILVDGLKTKVIVAGPDCSFGKDGLGNCALLEKYADELDYEVVIIEKECYKGKEISSTLVREVVEAGDMVLAEELLGQPYSITGQVIHGRKIGRTLGLPTVNLLPPEDKQLPPLGVYASQVAVDGAIFDGITNIGYKPTVGAEKQPGVETYIYNFDEDLYGAIIEVKLKHFHRAEMKFSSLDELKQQMKKDITECKN